MMNHSRSSWAQLLAAVLSIWCAVTPQAAATNRTIDDTFGDSATGAQITYGPTSTTWNVGQNCTYCSTRPDASLAFEHSWHDCEYSGGPVPTFSFSFTGVAVYIMFIIDNTNAPPVSLAFTLDGASAGSYLGEPIEDQPFYYNVPVFQKEGLTNTEHSMEVSMALEPNSQNVALFDYVIYTVEDEETSPTTPTSSPGGSSPTSSPQTTRASSSRTSATSPSSSATATSPTTTSPTSPQPATQTVVSVSTVTSDGQIFTQSSTSTISPTSLANSSTTTTTSPNLGAIVGGIVGAIVLVVVLVLLFWWRLRRGMESRTHTRLQDGPGDGGEAGAAAGSAAVESTESGWARSRAQQSHPGATSPAGDGGAPLTAAPRRRGLLGLFGARAPPVDPFILPSVSLPMGPMPPSPSTHSNLSPYSARFPLSPTSASGAPLLNRLSQASRTTAGDDALSSARGTGFGGGLRSPVTDRFGAIGAVAVEAQRGWGDDEKTNGSSTFLTVPQRGRDAEDADAEGSTESGWPSEKPRRRRRNQDDGEKSVASPTTTTPPSTNISLNPRSESSSVPPQTSPDAGLPISSTDPEMRQQIASLWEEVNRLRSIQEASPYGNDLDIPGEALPSYVERERPAVSSQSSSNEPGPSSLLPSSSSPPPTSPRAHPQPPRMSSPPPAPSRDTSVDARLRESTSTITSRAAVSASPPPGVHWLSSPLGSPPSQSPVQSSPPTQFRTPGRDRRDSTSTVMSSGPSPYPPPGLSFAR